MIDKIKECFQACLREGIFPREWKRAILVLIPKAPQLPIDDLPKVRPICLLNELGKALERIIAERLKDWMRIHPAALSENQYGFCKGRSTSDALIRVKREIETATGEGGVTIAVSLDITNAFNSLPWRVIRLALERKDSPEYLRRILDDYLHHRSVEFARGNKDIRSRIVTSGVPQGSILGPLLWNLSFDSVLQEGVEAGCQIVCYADDTLVLASADTILTATRRVNLQTALVVNRIRRLGLLVAAAKTEAVLFYGKSKPLVLPLVQVAGESIQTKDSMKYLGIILDSRLSFKPHFEYVERKASMVTRALGRLMPNLRGPGETKRRLYASVLQSIVLYGAPVWSDALSASRSSQMLLNRVFRVMALRVISGYRTVSLDAALILARIPPVYLMATLRRRVFERVGDLRTNSIWTKEEEENIKINEMLLLRRQWEIYLGRPNLSGIRTRTAILPHFGEWLERRHGGVTFRVTQLLTGHGCFGTYLYRIGKVDTPGCEHCDDEEAEDSAEHTLEECSAWSEERAILRNSLGLVVGVDVEVTLETIIGFSWVQGGLDGICQIRRECHER